MPEPRIGAHAHGEGDAPVVGAYGPYRGRRDYLNRDYDTPEYRMSIKPEQYDGTEDWEEYISHFEICAELGRWREQDRVLALAAALKGPARTFYISLTLTEKRTYDLLVQRLGQRFGSTRQQNRWLSRLEMRKSKPGESIAALADDLRQMAQRAYTDLDPRAQEVLALNQLYKSVSPEVKYQCTNQDCKSVTDAVEIIERYEAILGDGTDKKKSNIRFLSGNESTEHNSKREPDHNSEIQNTLQTLTRRIAEIENKDDSTRRQADFRGTQRLNYRPFNNKTSRVEVKCFLCDKPGHICKNCPVFIKCKAELQKQESRNHAEQTGQKTNTNQGLNQGNFRRPLAQ